MKDPVQPRVVRLGFSFRAMHAGCVSAFLLIAAIAASVTPVASQGLSPADKTFLDSISLPPSANPPLTLKGRAAVETMIGESIRMKNADGEYQLFFLHDGKLRVKLRNSERPLTGSYRNGDDAETICLTLNGQHESCNRLEILSDKLLLTDSRSGKTYEGVFTKKFLTPPTPPVRASLSSEVRTACEPLLQIVETGKRGRFDPLIDVSREAMPVEDSIRDPVQFSRIKIGNGCFVTSHMKEVELNDHRCLIRTERNGPDAEKAYRELVARIRQCLPGTIRQARLEEKPTMDSDGAKNAVSFFVISDNLTIHAMLGSAHLCRDYGFLNCRDPYGVTLRVRARPNDLIDRRGADTRPEFSESVRKLLKE